MTVPTRRTLWRSDGGSLPAEGMSVDALCLAYGISLSPEKGETGKPQVNPLASFLLKVSLATAVAAFSTTAPSVMAMGATSDIANIRMVDADDADSPVDTSPASDLSDNATSAVPTAPAGESTAPSQDTDLANADSGTSADDTPQPTESATDIPSEGELPEGDDPLAAIDSANPDPSDASFATLAIDEEAEGEGDVALMSGETLSVGNAADMAKAIESMGGVGTINITANFAVGNPISIPAGANLTVNLNGRTLTGSPVFDLAGGASLTVSGPGTLQGGSGNIFSAGGRIGSLNLTGGLTMRTAGNIFSSLGNFYGTTINAGCSSTSLNGLDTFMAGGCEIAFSNQMYVIKNWTGDDSETWYAKILVVYCLTEADYDYYVEHIGSDITILPETQYNVTFRTADKVVKVDAIYRGHCVGSKMSGDDGKPPTNEQMQALAPKGYRFDGWLDAKGKLYSIDEICAIPVTNHTTYTAKFTDVNVYYDVTFVYGKDLKTNAKKTFVEGAALEAPAASATTLSGYKLLGWYDAATDGKRVCTADGGGSSGVAKAMTLYAHYKYLGNYNVSLVVDYPTGAVSKNVNVTADGTVSAGQMPKVNAVAGYDFAGWKVASNGNTSDIGLSKPSLVTSTSDPTLVAITQPTTFTATFKKIAVGPVDPGPDVPIVPDDPVPVIPVNPVNPVNPVVPTPGPGAQDGTGDAGAGSAVNPSNPTNPRTPHSPATPWNPPGLALAAGFTVPAAGPGVSTRDELELAELGLITAGEGMGDGDDPDEATLFDAEALEDRNGLPFGAMEVTVALALAGGTALTAMLASNAAAFIGANAAAAAGGQAAAGAGANAAAGANAHARRPKGKRKFDTARARRRAALGLD